MFFNVKNKEKRINFIVKTLNCDIDSPFFRKLDEKDIQNLTNLMRPLVEDETVFGYFFSLDGKKDTDIYKILLNMLTASKEVFGNSWEDIFLSYNGYKILFDIFPSLIAKGLEKETLTKQYFIESFKKINLENIRNLYSKFIININDEIKKINS